MRAALAITMGALLALFALAGAPAAALRATVISPENDPRLDRSQVERAYLGHPAGPASDGLQVAIEEGGFELQAAGSAVALSTAQARSLGAARAAAQAAEKGGAALIVTDLPAAWTLAVADGVKVPVLNVGAAEDSLRQQDCRPRLYHLLPSERMRADALAQTLVARKWNKVLMLVGPSAQDQQRAATAQASLQRYALQVVASKPFKLSADPRERDLANPLLLTVGTPYDVVWVVDSDAEFARSLPYRTVLARPVVGDGGLVALAWHAQFERYGAPQLSRRFFKAARRPMTDHDWAAWMAGKTLVALAKAAPNGPPAAWAELLAQTALDGSKGVDLSFRTWDGQLRQPILLTDGQAVVAQAPIEGLLHPRDVLDTLGADAPEKLCKTVR